MTNLMIPIDDVLFAQLQQLALTHGRDVSTEAKILLVQSVEQAVQPLTGEFLHSFFKSIPLAQSAEEELVIELRSQHIDRMVDIE